MKYKKSLMIRALIIATVGCFGLANTLHAQIPSFRALNTQEKLAYPDEEVILRLIQSKADSIIAGRKFVSPEKATQQLKDNVNKRVKIKLIKPNTEVLSGEQIAKRLKQSMVVIADAYLCGRCDQTHIGPSSGYVIDEAGIVVTNHHVVENFAKPQTDGQSKLSLQIMTSDNQVYAVTEVLSSNPDLDLAILKVDVGNKKLVPLPIGQDVDLGAEVFVLSNPHMMFNFFSKGIVARKYSRHSYFGSKETFPEMDITADYAAGSSGAPVVDNKCNLVSTVSTTRSLYYDARKKSELQMVVKGTRPVIGLRELLTF
jgi:serine protease Do